jgi:hypothetical protein
LSIDSTLTSFHLPALERDILDLYLVQNFEIGGEVRNDLAVMEILYCNFDFWEVI